MVYGSVIGSSDPKSCIEEVEIEVKTRARAEDNKIADDVGDGKTEDEIVAEEIHRATERQYLWQEH